MKFQVQKIDTFSGHRDCVYTLEISDNSSIFFSAGGDGMVIRWDLNRPDYGELVAQVPASVYALAFDKNTNLLLVGQNYEGVQVIDVEKKQVVGSLKITSAAIFDIRIVDNEAYIAQSDGVITVIDIPNLAIKKHLKASDQSARCMAINADKTELTVGYSDSKIRIFGIEKGDLKQVIEGHTNSVFTLQYSPDGQFLISAGRDAHLKIWSVANGYTLQQDIPAHLFAINHLVFSPDNQYFATCSMDKSIKVWDATTFKLLKVIDRARHAGHATSVNKLLWTNHLQQLITASDDRKISVWELQKLT